MNEYDRAKQKIGKAMGGGEGGGGKDDGDQHPEGASADEQRQLEDWAKSQGATLHHEEEPGLPVAIVRAALERDGLRCVVCHTNDDLTVHHVRHTDEEGEAANGPEDLNTVCTTDHDALHNLQREALKREGNSGDAHENILVGPEAGDGEGEGGDEGKGDEGDESK